MTRSDWHTEKKRVTKVANHRKRSWKGFQWMPWNREQIAILFIELSDFFLSDYWIIGSLVRLLI